MAEQENNGVCSSESCSGCAHADSCASKKVDMTVPANEYTHVKKVIGVISGKGGVGKSMVTASLARLMREQGYSVGILDADITGPSIPKMYGIHEHAMGTEVGMFPCIAKDETRIMSVNLLLDSEDTPVIWRGPVIAGVVKQFWNEVLWGDLASSSTILPPTLITVSFSLIIIPNTYIHKVPNGSWKEILFLLPKRSYPLSPISSPKFRVYVPVSSDCIAHSPILPLPFLHQ